MIAAQMVCALPGISGIYVMSKLSIVFKILTVLSVLVLSLAGVGVMAITTMQNIN